MHKETQLIERLRDLRNEINLHTSYALDSSVEKAEIADIEKKIINIKLTRLNNEYIATHNWTNKHLSTAENWDIVVYQDLVCRVKTILRTTYNEADDTYNYTVVMSSLFIEKEFEIEFGYYDTVDFIVLDQPLN